MKLAEALQERADLNRRIAQLRSRLLSNAQVQEGETPSEDPQELLTELDSCIMRLSSLMTRINLCNSQHSRPRPAILRRVPPARRSSCTAR